MTQLLPLIEAIPPIKGNVGAPLSKPAEVIGDRGYDSDAHRMSLSAKGIRPTLARRGEPRTAAAWGSSAGWWSGA